MNYKQDTVTLLRMFFKTCCHCVSAMFHRGYAHVSSMVDGIFSVSFQHFHYVFVYPSQLFHYLYNLYTALHALYSVPVMQTSIAVVSVPSGLDGSFIAQPSPLSSQTE
jgi:hypothetical protein